MEGIPDLPAAPPLPDSGSRVGARRAGHRALTWVGERIPGVGLAAAVAWLMTVFADRLGRDLLGFPTSPINGIPLAIVLGAAICNTTGVPEIFQKGLRTCTLLLLRFAIILLGLRLSLAAIGAIGLSAIPVVVLCIATALLIVPWIGTRAGLPRRLATLIAVGTGICGISAIMATAPAIEAEKDEVSYAVACVALFGVFAMLIYPFIVPFLFGGAAQPTGIFLGTAIHDTTQVTGAALVYSQMHHDPAVLATATVVKIVRNLSMVIVIPLMAGLFHRRSGAAKGIFHRWQQVVPLFVIGFLAMALVRTIGDASVHPLGIFDEASWPRFLRLADGTCTKLLTVVMAAIGLNTGLSQIKKLGVRPLFVGLSAALAVGAVSLAVLKARAALGF